MNVSHTKAIQVLLGIMMAFATSCLLVTNITPKKTSISERKQPNHFMKRHRAAICSLSSEPNLNIISSPQALTKTSSWRFRGHRLEFISALPPGDSSSLPAIILIHGFGANSRHWRFNLQPLSQAGFRVFALDLIGFGMGDKPMNETYTFDTWSDQIRFFIRKLVLWQLCKHQSTIQG